MSRKAQARIRKAFEVPEEQRHFNVFAKDRVFDFHMPPRKLKTGLAPPLPSESSPASGASRPKKKARTSEVPEVTVVTGRKSAEEPVAPIVPDVTVASGSTNLGDSTIPAGVPCTRVDSALATEEIDPAVARGIEYLRTQISSNRAGRIGSAELDAAIESSASRAADVSICLSCFCQTEYLHLWLIC